MEMRIWVSDISAGLINQRGVEWAKERTFDLVWEYGGKDFALLLLLRDSHDCNRI
jgi:hypothetical protein